MEPEFLGVDTVIELHRAVISQTPEEPSGIHSITALESAVISPQNHYTFGGVDDLCVLAAHYLFHITMCHSFLAGNKRTAAAACVTFLELNGLNCAVDADSFEAIMLKMIAKDIGIGEVARYLRSCTSPMPT